MTALKYGPNTPQIEAIIERVKEMSEGDAGAVEKIYWKLDLKTFDEAFHKAQDVLGDDYTVPDLPYRMDLREPKAGWKFTALSEIFYDAILALLAQPYIGTEFTQEMYDALLGPWREFEGGGER